MKYAVVFEQADDGGWGAYAPDLPGLGVVGPSLAKLRELIRDGIKFHIEGMHEDGLRVPVPTTQVEVIDAA